MNIAKPKTSILISASEVISIVNIKNGINSKYLANLKVAEFLKKLYCFTKFIYLEVLALI